MAARVHVGIVGDFDAGSRSHAATTAALAHAAASLGCNVTSQWVPTAALHDDVDSWLSGFNALWVAPGSPYASLNGALAAIRFGREREIPVLGTCGGCQHMVLEYARNILGIGDAAHAEYDPAATVPVVSRLTCSLAGQTLPVNLAEGSRVRGCYDTGRINEPYLCSFGVNPAYEAALDRAGLRIVGRDDAGSVRVLEHDRQPFFVATLFVPQIASSPARPHPLVVGYLRAARERPGVRG